MKKSYIMLLTLFVSIFFLIPKVGKADDYDPHDSYDWDNLEGYCLYTYVYNSGGTHISYSSTKCGSIIMGVSREDDGTYVPFMYQYNRGNYSLQVMTTTSTKFQLHFVDNAIVCPTIYVYEIDEYTFKDNNNVEYTITDTCYISPTALSYFASNYTWYTYTIDPQAPEASTGSEFTEYWEETSSSSGSGVSVSFSDTDWDNFCSISTVQSILKVVSYLITIVKIVIPLLLMIMGSIDFAKAVTSGDDKQMNLSLRTFVIRLVSAVIIFLIPSIIKMVFNIVAPTWKNETGFYQCVACTLDSSECGS